MKTLVATHIYKKAERFLQEMFDSVSAQSDQNFDFLVFNYDIENLTNNFLFEGVVVDNNDNFCIPDARHWTIKYARKHNYDLLIFIDADDTMALDRVEVTKNSISDKYAFYYTQLLTMGENLDFFSGNLPLNINKISDVLDCNCVGLSNLALYIPSLPKNIETFEVNKNIIAYDWFLISLLLALGCKGKLVNSNTYYRIHEANIAGFTNSSNMLMVERTINVKVIHYRALLEVFNFAEFHIPSVLKLLIENKMKLYDSLSHKELSQDIVSANKNRTKGNTRSSFWWNLI